MEQETYIRLYRKTISSDVWEMGPLAVQLWIYIMLRAVFRPEGYTMPNGKTHVERGQFLTTYPQLQEALRHKRGKGFSRLDGRGVVITLLNYDTYNPLENESGGQSGGDSGRTIRKSTRRKSTTTSVKSEFSRAAARCLKAWTDLVPLPKTTTETYCLTKLAEILRIQKVPEETLTRICAYAAQVWVIEKDLIDSPGSLRERTKKGDPERWERILLEMQRSESNKKSTEGLSLGDRMRRRKVQP